MEFVDRRTLSRHNPTPPSRDTVTYPLRCGGNWRLVPFLSPNSVALTSPSRAPHRLPRLLKINKPPSNNSCDAPNKLFLPSSSIFFLFFSSELLVFFFLLRCLLNSIYRQTHCQSRWRCTNLANVSWYGRFQRRERNMVGQFFKLKRFLPRDMSEAAALLLWLQLFRCCTHCMNRAEMIRSLW